MAAFICIALLVYVKQSFKNLPETQNVIQAIQDRTRGDQIDSATPKTPQMFCKEYQDQQYAGDNGQAWAGILHPKHYFVPVSKADCSDIEVFQHSSVPNKGNNGHIIHNSSRQIIIEGFLKSISRSHMPDIPKTGEFSNKLHKNGKLFS
jgi:hypothetical protein